MVTLLCGVVLSSAGEHRSDNDCSGRGLAATAVPAATFPTAIMTMRPALRNSASVLHTSVTIGYDAPWKTVHGLLIAAATAANNTSCDQS